MQADQSLRTLTAMVPAGMSDLYYFGMASRTDHHYPANCSLTQFLIFGCLLSKISQTHFFIHFTLGKNVSQSLGQANTKWNTLCMLVFSQCGKMCGNELSLVNTFSVMLRWVELALIKKWLCLLVLCKLFRSTSDPNNTSDLCFPL